MNATEATSNIIVTMINNKLLNTPEEIAEAFQSIYPFVRDPYNAQ